MTNAEPAQWYLLAGTCLQPAVTTQHKNGGGQQCRPPSPNIVTLSALCCILSPAALLQMAHYQSSAEEESGRRLKGDCVRRVHISRGRRMELRDKVWLISYRSVPATHTHTYAFGDTLSIPQPLMCKTDEFFGMDRVLTQLSSTGKDTCSHTWSACVNGSRDRYSGESLPPTSQLRV